MRIAAVFSMISASLKSGKKIGCVITLSLLTVAGSSVAVDDETRAAMRRIFDSLTGAFVLGLDEEAFAAKASRRKVISDLSTLASEAEHLESHGGALGPDYTYLRASLARDARDSLRLFRNKDHEGARITLRQLTENCLACHSKLPAEGNYPLATAFLSDDRVKALPLEERVRLEVMSRQFERALESYESLLTSPASQPDEVYFMGAFEGYLKVCLRVRGDVDRATATLEDFRRRTDVPRYLQEYVATWIKALHTLPSASPSDNALTRARSLVESAGDLQLYPGDRRGLAHYVMASGILHRYLESASLSSEQRCQAYYLLGTAELGISKLSWLSEAEQFLEAAVRTCSGSPDALRAYLALEEHLLTIYSGSAGLHVPPEEEARLEELWSLVGRP